MSNVTHQPKIGFVSLGCPKNLVDSERILTELRTEGYDVVPSYDKRRYGDREHLRVYRQRGSGITGSHR